MYRPHTNEMLVGKAITLTAQELAAIDAIAPKRVAAGLRYPEHTMASVNR